MVADVWIYPMVTIALAFLVILEYIVKQVYITKIYFFDSLQL